MIARGALRAILATGLSPLWFISQNAHAQVVLSDTFTGTSASLSWQTYGGACLTAGSGAGSIPACAAGSQGGLNGAAPDTSGNGMLRLTEAVGNAAGGVISLNAFPSSAGFTATFSSVAYGGTGADGITLMLLDASAGIPAGLGLPGGALSYGGITGGYIGVGLDEYGNFNIAGCAQPTTCTGGGAFSPNTVVVRGATANGNAWIASTQVGSALWNNVTTRAAATLHTYKVTMTAAGLLSVQVDGVTRINNVSALAQTGAIPAFLRVGFAASTGGATNVHEIRSFQISTLSFSNLVVAKTSKLISDPVNGATNPKMIPGARLRYCIQVSNLAGSPTATGITVTDPLASVPVTFVAGSSFVNGTQTSGTCNADGTAGGTFASNTVTATLNNLAGGATETMYFDVTLK